MKAIPVIDLLAGKAVHACGGQRHAYRPLQTKGCKDGDALSLARYYTQEFGADRLYIADLDRIEKRGHHLDLIQRMAEALPTVTLWVDAGVQHREDLAALWAIPGVLPIIGSERLVDPTLPNDPDLRGRTVLSLDFTKDGLVGPIALQRQPLLWSRETILMDISRVGGAQGPNLARLADHLRRGPSIRWFVAGGVRDARDLAALQEQGASGVLLATSLHDGRITRAEMAALAERG